jgi:hypothetical protein
MNLTANEVKKELYKSKAMAKFSYYVGGSIYYTVKLESGTYKFPMSTVEENEGSVKLSSDLGTTEFFAEMKGSELNRWIQMAIKSGEFMKVS